MALLQWIVDRIYLAWKWIWHREHVDMSAQTLEPPPDMAHDASPNMTRSTPDLTSHNDVSPPSPSRKRGRTGMSAQADLNDVPVLVYKRRVRFLCSVLLLGYHWHGHTFLPNLLAKCKGISLLAKFACRAIFFLGTRLENEGFKILNLLSENVTKWSWI